MENRHQLKSLKNFFSGLDGHSCYPHLTPGLHCVWTWNSMPFATWQKSYNFQNPSNLKHQYQYFSSLTIITLENKALGGRHDFFRKTMLIHSSRAHLQKDPSFPGLISIHKYVTELKVSTFQNEVVWMSGEMGLQKIHSNFVSRQFTFGPVMIWVFLLIGEI